MDNIPAATIEAALKLRAANGLEATKEALLADLEKSGASWKLEETLRYRKAGESPFYISGRYLTANGIDPATGEKDGKEPKPAKRNAGKAEEANGKVNEEAFLRVLHGKGFAVKVSKNLLTGEIEREVPQAIEKLGLRFGSAPARTEEIHVSQTSPQIQVTLALDKFLELAGIKP